MVFLMKDQLGCMMWIQQEMVKEGIKRSYFDLLVPYREIRDF